MQPSTLKPSHSSHESMSELSAEPLQESLKDCCKLQQMMFLLTHWRNVCNSHHYQVQNLLRNHSSCHHMMYFQKPTSELCCSSLQEASQELMQVVRDNMSFQLSQDHSQQMFEVPNVNLFLEDPQVGPISDPYH